MKRTSCLLTLVVFATFTLMANAGVEPVSGGYQVSYDIKLTSGSSNGNDIGDALIFEWNGSGEFSVDGGFTINGRGQTQISHVIGFDPTSAFVIGWGAAIPGVGDEKNHLFTLSNFAFAAEARGKKWSVAFPGVPPEPRTGHNAMIGLLQSAATGDVDALDAVSEFVKREAEPAGFDPRGNFRVLEWTVAEPIDLPVLPVPVMPLYGLVLLILGLLVLARRFISSY
jgi:hypothetical protein